MKDDFFSLTSIIEIETKEHSFISWLDKRSLIYLIWVSKIDSSREFRVIFISRYHWTSWSVISYFDLRCWLRWSIDLASETNVLMSFTYSVTYSSSLKNRASSCFDWVNSYVSDFLLISSNQRWRLCINSYKSMFNKHVLFELSISKSFD